MYDYNRIKGFLQSKTGFIDPNDKDKGHIFDLYFDFTIYRVVILIAKDYELDLTDGGFASLLGYEKKILKDETNFTGEMIPDITRSVFSSLRFDFTAGERRRKRCFVQLFYHKPPGQLPFQTRTASTRVPSCEQNPDRFCEGLGYRRAKQHP